MAKKFNVTGPCFPARHYMADVSAKLRQTMQMVEQGDYFVINRPRQYGKTTTLILLAQALQRAGGFVSIRTSFEGLGDNIFKEESEFCRAFLKLLEERLEQVEQEALASFLHQQAPQVENLRDVSKLVTKLAKMAAPLRLVLLIDEVDKSSNNQLFISFLGMLRDKYIEQAAGEDLSFHAVVLAGVHDVKSLKLKIRPDAETKLNSPWNIAAEFNVDMSLQPTEIIPMLEDFARERAVELDASALAERLFFYTSGYPFLVSRLCKIVDEQILPAKNDAVWTTEDLDSAAGMLTKESNANFDSLIKNLENNPELYQAVFNVVTGERYIEYNLLDPIVNLGVLYGIFRNGAGIRIHNRIYQEIIYNYVISKVTREAPPFNFLNRGEYLLPGNRLDMPKLLLKFQVFMREQYSKKDRNFLERHGRLVFLAFLKPIINGAGYEFKEPQLSEEKRIDVVLTFFQHKYIVELKIWRGEEAHKKGLAQLADYLDRLHLDEGYLLIFDHSEVKSWQQGWESEAGKRLFVAWV